MPTAMRNAMEAALGRSTSLGPDDPSFICGFEFTVPRGLNLATALNDFVAGTAMKCNVKLTDANFAKVDTSQLVPGRAYRVRLYVAHGRSTRDWIRFLRERNAILAGPQALVALARASRVFQSILVQKRVTVVSFAAKEELPKDMADVRVAPAMSKAEFGLVPFICEWPKNYAVLCIS